MKSGASSLNPYAAAYVPLTRRESQVTGQESVSVQYQHDDIYNSDHQGAMQFSSPKVSPQKSSPVHQVFGGPLSQNPPGGPIDSQILDEDSDMDIEYLLMQFPGLSRESITDVYFANNCDLEAATDMICQLEIDCPENLPDTLDIGDVPESGSSATCALKQKYVAAVEVTGETSASSSGSSGPVVAS